MSERHRDHLQIDQLRVSLLDVGEPPPWLAAASGGRYVVVHLGAHVDGHHAERFGAASFGDEETHVSTPVWEDLERRLGRYGLSSVVVGHGAATRRDLLRADAELRWLLQARPLAARARSHLRSRGQLGVRATRGPAFDPGLSGAVARAYGYALRSLVSAANAGAALGRDEASSLAAAGPPLEEWATRTERYLCVPTPPHPTVNGTAVNAFPDVDYIRHLPKDGTKGHLLEREALRHGLESERFPNGSFVVSDADGRSLNFKWGRSPIASGVALSLCSYKEATRALMARADVPVPEGRVFPADRRAAAIAYAERIRYPVVCKPVAGLRGIGVVTNIRDRSELESALELIAQSEMGDDDFIVERHVSGEDYRIVVVGGRIVAAVLREPASVTGDGLHNVLDLIEYKNRLRMENPHLRSRPIRVSAATRYQLGRVGLDLLSVPEPGRKVVLANSANLSQGGDSIEVADELEPSIEAAVLRAVEAVPGLGFCGLDMLIEDHCKPLDEQQATVIELNAHAAIGSAQYPSVGESRPVAREFFLECVRRHELAIDAEPADRLAVSLNIRGKVTATGYRAWFARHAEGFGVKGWIKNVGDKRVRARIEGDADAVAALSYLAIQGPRRAAPSSVRTTHVEPSGFRRFVARE